MNIQLTDEQTLLVKKAKDWYFNASTGQVFQYSAPAGAGKSTVMHAIIEDIGLDETEVAPMAYTGAAAIVMRLNGFHNACTIHSWLYEPREFTTLDEKTNKFRKDFRFVYRGVPKNKYRLICIDEGSMVPRHMLEDILKSDLKVLVCGDLNQLPPVKDSPAFLYDGEIFRLTKIMRQSTNSAIVEMSQRILHGLPLIPGEYGDVTILQKEDFDRYMDSLITNTHIVLCGTNSSRDWINDHIRTNILNIRDNLPHFGERVICRKNNWKIEVDGINLANGLVGTVKSAPSISTFENDSSFSMDFTPDLFPQITFENINCDYKYFQADNKLRQEMKSFGSPNYRPNGEKFEYGYAITTHLSQGSQYIDGIYLQEYMGGGPEYLKHLNYTAITRFRNKCFYILPNQRRHYKMKKSIVTFNGQSVI